MVKKSFGTFVFGLLLIISPVCNLYNKSPSLKAPQAIIPIYIFSLISIASGIGVLMAKEWARKLVIIFAVFLMVICLAMLFINSEVIFKNISNFIMNLWVFIYSGVLLYFFTRPKVKEQFRYKLPSKTSDNTA